MKKKIVTSFLSMLLLLWLSHVYAGYIMKSSAYDTENKCKTSVTKNNQLYLNYSRSTCYNDWWYYYYNICAKWTDCNSWNSSTTNSSSLLSSCKIDTSLWDKLKSKLDNVVEKITKKLWNKDKIIKWYVYGFYDYFLWKVATSDKYKNNKVIQVVRKYLRDKFSCGAKKWIWTNQEVSVDTFLWSVFGWWLKWEDRKKKLKDFIVFMEEKWIKKGVLKSYINDYNTIPNDDKKILLSYLKSINNQVLNCKLKQGYYPNIIKEWTYKVLYKPYHKYYNITCKNWKIIWSNYVWCMDWYYWNKYSLNYACVKKVSKSLSSRYKLK